VQKTLKDIARELGVSTATISRALNKSTSGMVRPETRDKILEYVRRTGFKPNTKASALAKGKLTNLFLILSQKHDSIFFDQYYIKIIRGIHDVIVDTEYSLGLLSIDEGFSPEDIDEILFRNETAGLILSPHCHANKIYPRELLEKYDFPVVSIDNEVEGNNVYTVLLDQEGAGFKGAEFLAGKGYKNIVLVSDSEHSAHSEMRKKGFYSFFDAASDKSFDLTCLEFPFSLDAGESALNEIVKLGKFPVGVFALNDELASGILGHIPRAGLKCPGDIGILGFDGLTIGQYLSPRMYSVSFPIREVGKKTAEILVETLEGKKLRKNKIVFDAVITSGESC